MEKRNINLVRGDTLAFDVKVSELDGSDITSMYFSAKKKATDTEYAFQKSLSDGITLVAENTYKVRVAPEDTADLDVGKYVYDLQIGLGPDIYTILMGVIALIQDVTTQ